MSWLSSLIFGKDPGGPSAQTNKKFSDALEQSGQNANALNSEFQSHEASFDPAAAFATYAKGAEGQFQTQLGQNEKELAGKDVGAGRLNTGFFDEDNGLLMRNMASDFSNNLATHALDAAGLESQHALGVGQLAANAQGNYLDAISGEEDREQGAANAKAKQRGDFVNGLMQLGGTIAGAFA